MNDCPRISAAILCGGTSTRLGYPKEMLRVEGEPLAVKLADKLQNIFDEVLLVTNTPEFLQHCLDVPMLSDEYPRLGPLAGIHAALKGCRFESCFILAVDMPLVDPELMRLLCRRYREGPEPVVLPRADGRLHPLCGVYGREVLPRLEAVLDEGEDLSVAAFLRNTEVGEAEVDPGMARCLRDIDTRSDIRILGDEFEDIAPLPLKHVQLAGGNREDDYVMEEWPLAVFVNGYRLVTVLCLPTAIPELAVGLGTYLGLIERPEQINDVSVDYRQRRVRLSLDVSDEDVHNASQVLITSTCGASTYGGTMPELRPEETAAASRISGEHILDGLDSLRGRAPVFGRTGGTHQAAFTDGRRVQSFFEDVGRHNAVDKIVGHSVLEGHKLSAGAVLVTGRISSEMVVKSVRLRIPVLAGRAAVTTNAIRLAREHGLTLIGFARGSSLNIYTYAERIVWKED